MIWWLVILGGVLVILAGMYVPNWVRWARWHSSWKKASPSKRRHMRPPVAPPFWVAYSDPGGAYGPDWGYGGGFDSGSDGGFGAAAGFDGGGGDGGGGGD